MHLFANTLSGGIILIVGAIGIDSHIGLHFYQLIGIIPFHFLEMVHLCDVSIEIMKAIWVKGIKRA